MQKGRWRGVDPEKMNDQVPTCSSTAQKGVRDHDQSRSPNPTWNRRMIVEWKCEDPHGEAHFDLGTGWKPKMRVASDLVSRCEAEYRFGCSAGRLVEE